MQCIIPGISNDIVLKTYDIKSGTCIKDAMSIAGNTYNSDSNSLDNLHQVHRIPRHQVHRGLRRM